MVNTTYVKIILHYGKEILAASSVKEQKGFVQHGSYSVYDHCVAVAYVSIAIAHALHIKVRLRSLVRGALLHDYFLYDWHKKDKAHKWHGFTHAKRALANAERDFAINDVERDIICKHMFPLNLKPPRYRESCIVCFADKICAVGETLSLPWLTINKLKKYN